MIFKKSPLCGRLLFSLLVPIIFISCNEEDPEPEAPQLSLSAYTTSQLEKVNQMAIATNSLWPEYDYMSTVPIYYLLEDNGNTHGYIINPPNPMPDGSITVNAFAGQTLEIVRNDSMLTGALAVLGEFGRFDFSYFHEGVEYFILFNRTRDDYFYDIYKNQDDNWGPLVLAHEVFHKYQHDHWTPNEQWIQDIENYPFDNELLAWHLYFYDLMADVHHVESDAEANDYLKTYVAVMTHMQTLDFSDDELVRRMGTYQELNEGSARYVETFAAEQVFFPSIHEDPSHGWRGFLEAATTEIEVRIAIAFRLWYHSGAGATHLLSLVNAPIYSAYPQFITPFEVARDQLQLSDQEINDIIAEISSLSSWGDYQQQAATYMQLFD